MDRIANDSIKEIAMHMSVVDLARMSMVNKRILSLIDGDFMARWSILHGHFGWSGDSVFNGNTLKELYNWIVYSELNYWMDKRQLDKLIQGNCFTYSTRGTVMQRIDHIPGKIVMLKKHIKEFDMPYQKITRIPDGLCMLNLELLNLHKNIIEEIPAAIGLLTNIKILILSENCIKIIPDEIKNLKKLEELNLGRNCIKIIPTCIGELTSLQELSLVNNEITTLPVEIAQLVNLKYLFIDENEIVELKIDKKIISFMIAGQIYTDIWIGGNLQILL